MDSGIRGISVGKGYVFYKCELLYVYISLVKYQCNCSKLVFQLLAKFMVGSQPIKCLCVWFTC